MTKLVYGNSNADVLLIQLLTRGPSPPPSPPPPPSPFEAYFELVGLAHTRTYHELKERPIKARVSLQESGAMIPRNILRLGACEIRENAKLLVGL